MYRGKAWHKECFICVECRKALADDKFTSNNDQPYCLDCHTKVFCQKCTACKKPIIGGICLGLTIYLSLINTTATFF